MKRALIYIVGIWIAVLIHAWATRFVMVPNSDKGMYLTNRMTGEVYLVSESAHGVFLHGPFLWRSIPEEQADKLQ